LWLYLLEKKRRKLLNLPLVIKTGFAGNFPLSFPNIGFFFLIIEKPLQPPLVGPMDHPQNFAPPPPMPIQVMFLT